MFKSWFAKDENRACRKRKIRFKSKFVKGESITCKRRINMGHTS
jgi:hypothetical protein